MLLWFLLFFTSVPWGILPSTNLVDCADNCYTSLIFFFLPSFLFFSPWNLKNCFFLSSFFSLLFSFLLYLAFFSNLLSFDFSFPITLFCLLLPYVLLLLNLFSLYYLSYFKVLYLIPIFHLLCSCLFSFLLLVKILWYSCYLPPSHLLFPIFSLFISGLHLDLVCTLSVVLFLVGSLLYIYYSCSLSLFP